MARGGDQAPCPRGELTAAAIKARDAKPRCGAYIIDTRNSDILHWLRFEGGVRELFDVGFLPAPMCVGLAAPEMRTLITLEGADAIPAPAKEEERIG